MFKDTDIGDCASTGFAFETIQGGVSFASNDGWGGDFLQLILEEGVIFRCDINVFIDCNDIPIGCFPNFANFVCNPTGGKKFKLNYEITSTY